MRQSTGPCARATKTAGNPGCDVRDIRPRAQRRSLICTSNVEVPSKAENTDTVEVEAKPGSLLYVWQEVKMGVLSARTKLHVVEEAQGKKGVQETKLAESK